MIDRLLSFIAPHLCSGCGQIGSTFCDNCKYNIINESFSGCILCGKPRKAGVCSDHKLSFKQAWAVGERSGPLQRLVGGFKFRNMKSASVELAGLLDSRLPTLPRSCVLVPIPTTPMHIRERGYDHILLIAKHLGRMRRLPVRTVLQRDHMSVQHHANRQQRLEQVKRAFRVEGDLDPRAIYVLIDDVLTTGATIEQAALLLRNAGATTVWVAVIARQPLD